MISGCLIWRRLWRGSSRMHPTACCLLMLRPTLCRPSSGRQPGRLRGLAAILGHRSLDTVMVYTEPSADDLAARMARAEAQLVSGASEAD